MRSKTRILVTHALDCLPRCDRIILLSKGSIQFDGNYKELSKTDFFENIKSSLDHAHSEQVDEEVEENKEISSPTKSYLSSKETLINTKEQDEKVDVSFKTYKTYYCYSITIFILAIISILIYTIGIGASIVYEYSILAWIQELAVTKVSN